MLKVTEVSNGVSTPKEKTLVKYAPLLKITGVMSGFATLRDKTLVS